MFMVGWSQGAGPEEAGPRAGPEGASPKGLVPRVGPRGEGMVPGPVPRRRSRTRRGAGPVQATFLELTRPDIYCTDRLKNLFEERCM